MTVLMHHDGRSAAIRGAIRSVLTIGLATNWLAGGLTRLLPRRRVAANEAARFTAVVVLPTPPFWFATAMIRFIAASYSANRGAVAAISPV